MLRILTVVIAILAIAATVSAKAHQAGKRAPNDVLNVHVVCHTHDDVGWLKTVDQYYLGDRNDIQHAGVQYILDSVIPQLVANPKRKFIYVEIGFFIRWWNEQSDDMKQTVKSLVSNGQLEFINGGWCMNDEATTYYVDIIDQMTAGHQFILENFGTRPRIGWHIDPFGHSSVQASLFALMGFDGFFVGRIDYDDKNNRLANKNMETMWRGSASLQEEGEIFFGLNYNGYNPPDGLCFDQFCTDTPVQDDPNIFNYNLPQRAQDFVKAAQDQAKHYRTNNVMFTMGSDFEYENANLWFKNLDKLLNYFEAHPELGLNVFYSTPSMYLDSLHAANLTWSVKTDDFFPYADCPWCFWTGYFVSRIAVKGYVRYLSNYLQTCRHLETFLKTTGKSYSGGSDTLEKAMAVAQHHDGVSGTEKQHVAYDYALRLSIGQDQCEQLINDAMTAFTAKSHKTSAKFAIQSSSVGGDSFVQCRLLNESVCEITSSLQPGQTVAITIYNPLARARTSHTRLPLATNFSHVVTDSKGNTVDSTVVSDIDQVNPNGQPFTLVFSAQLPALGFATYFLTRSQSSDGPSNDIFTIFKTNEIDMNPEDDTVSIGNSHLTLTFSKTTGRIVSWENRDLGQTVQVDQALMWYNSSDGNNINSTQPSGAYIFRPNSTSAFYVNGNGDATITVNVGSVVQEVQQVFTSWAKQTFILYTDSAYVEVIYEVGPIPVGDSLGKEIISRFDTNLATASMFYTDANGREMQVRQRNYRPTWKYNNTDSISGNYYPINSAAFIQDTSKNLRFTAITDRSVGGASINDGSMEIMIHRRTVYDDNRGVGEPISEPGIDGKGLIVRTRHVLVMDTLANSPDIHRNLEERVTFPATLVFASTPDPQTWINSHTTSFSAAGAELPPNVHLVTLKYWADNVLLIRLAHMFEVSESQKYSGPVSVDLSTIISSNIFEIDSVTELTLSANQNLADLHRLSWTTQSKAKERFSDNTIRGTTVTLAPMEIRTYQVTLKQAFDSNLL